MALSMQLHTGFDYFMGLPLDDLNEIAETVKTLPRRVAGYGGKSKTYELAVKIAGKYDSSMKKACLDAEKDLSALGKSARAAGKVATTALAAAATAAAAVATTSPFYIRRL